MIKNVKTEVDYFSFKEVLEKQNILKHVSKLKFLFLEADYTILIHPSDTSNVRPFLTCF